ncbi:hypothetical protein [Ferruginibacter sp. SUN106]|uniref:hypothetical protein n=1 Tax=Ferruginibacter sp. SUN106 TaxID=2978348 RepID=UPI003D36728D
MIFILALLSMGLFIYFKNRQDNRKIERQNRLDEKREKLIAMLKEKNITEDEN